METKLIRTKTYELPEGAMSYEQLNRYFRETLAERDALRAVVRFGLDRLIPAHADRNPAEQQFFVEARAALKVS